MVKNYVSIKVNVLRDFISRVFNKLGVPSRDAKISADILVAADQRGINSHGVQRLITYVDRLREGSMKPKANIVIIRETPNTFLISGGDGLGFIVGYRSMKMVINKALKNNVALAAVRDSNHFGISGYFAMMALQYDLIGISLTNTVASVVPTFGREAMVGTNPIAIAVPACKEKPIVLDMATSIVTAGKLEMYQREKKKIPKLWAVDESGNPSDDASRVLNGFRTGKGGGLLPLGGMEEDSGGHKGYGLSFVVDILCGVLAGSRFGPDLYKESKVEPGNKVSHFFGAIKIGAFLDPELFKTSLDRYINLLKNSKKVNLREKIFVHGEKEFEIYEKQREEVKIQDQVVLELRNIGKDVGVKALF